MLGVAFCHQRRADACLMEPKASPLPLGRQALAVLTFWALSVTLLPLATSCRGTKRVPATRAANVSPVWSPDGRRIAFVSMRDGNSEVYVMNASGSRQTNLTRNPAGDSSPAWSPSGNKIAFVSTRDRDEEIYVMNADGSRPANLTRSRSADRDPLWSPDGRRIVFLSYRDQNWEVYVMNADGSGQTNLTRHPGHDSGAAWSPDGTRIAFESTRDGNSEIYVMRADGSGLTNLTRNPGADAQLSWFSDGSRIAFYSIRRSPQRAGVYVMNSDGSKPNRVSPGYGPNWHPVCSPDGAGMAYECQSDLVLTGRDGSHTVSVGNGWCSSFAWSPDGEKVAFVGGIYGGPEKIRCGGDIYVVNADGSGLMRLTRH